MSKKGNARRVPPSNSFRKPRRIQPPQILIPGSHQPGPIDDFSNALNWKEQIQNYGREWRNPLNLGPWLSHRGYDRSCCIKPQLKDVGQLTQLQSRDTGNKTGPARSYRHQAGFLTNRSYSKLFPPVPTTGQGVTCSKHTRAYTTKPNLTPRQKATSPLPPQTSAGSRHVPLRSVAHRYLNPPKPNVKPDQTKLDPWFTTSMHRSTTPGGTTIEELEKYIASPRTIVNAKPENAKAHRETIDELKQLLVSESFEIPIIGQRTVPAVPNTPNVTPKTSFNYTDSSDLRFATPKTSPLRQSLLSVDNVEKMKPMVDKLLCTGVQMVENSSQFTEEGMVPVGVATSEDMWQIVESVGDVPKYLDEDTMTEHTCEQRSVVVSDKPRIKVIAEKFARFKKDDIELRKLEEKVVCLEYDVCGRDPDKRKQLMRAYFSVKPTSKHGNGKEKENDVQFTQLKKHFVSESQDNVNKCGDREIEIIDGQLEENHGYIKDLVKVLNKKKVIDRKKNKKTFDVVSLYDMAKTQKVIDENEIHFFNQAQLEEVKEMILKTRTSSTHAINRRKIHYQEGMSPRDTLNVSKSIINELYRESRKL